MSPVNESAKEQFMAPENGEWNINFQFGTENREFSLILEKRKTVICFLSMKNEKERIETTT